MVLSFVFHNFKLSTILPFSYSSRLVTRYPSRDFYHQYDIYTEQYFCFTITTKISVRSLYHTREQFISSSNPLYEKREIIQTSGNSFIYKSCFLRKFFVFPESLPVLTLTCYCLDIPTVNTYIVLSGTCSV